MKNKILKLSAVFGLVFLLFSTNLFAQNSIKKIGIGLRGSYWKVTNDPSQIIIKDHNCYSAVNIGNAGGWIYLFSRFNKNMFFEIHLGGIGNASEEEYCYTETNVEVFAVTPILFGIRYDVLPIETQSNIVPYVTFGGGPYWFSTVNVKEQVYQDVVKVTTNLKSGGYIGGGFNFRINNWFAINFDTKYHFINFNVEHDYSGFEYGIGVNFMWGSYEL